MRFRIPRPDKVPASPLSRVSIKVLAVFAVVQGLGIILSDESRFAAAAYTLVREVPGGMNTWGAAILAAGVLTFAGSLTRKFWVKGAGVVLASAWCALFGAGGFLAYITTPNGGPTGPPTYYFAACCAFVLFFVDESRDAR